MEYITADEIVQSDITQSFEQLMSEASKSEELGIILEKMYSLLQVAFHYGYSRGYEQCMKLYNIEEV